MSCNPGLGCHPTSEQQTSVIGSYIEDSFSKTKINNLYKCVLSVFNERLKYESLDYWIVVIISYQLNAILFANKS